MARYISSMLPFGAVAAVMMLSTALPAQAAESAFGREVKSTNARSLTPGVRHRTAQRIRFAAWGGPAANADCVTRPIELVGVAHRDIRLHHQAKHEREEGEGNSQNSSHFVSPDKGNDGARA